MQPYLRAVKTEEDKQVEHDRELTRAWLSAGQGSVSRAEQSPEEPDSIRSGLLEAGARRRLAQRLEADATSDLIAWVRAAHEADWEIKVIAEYAGVTWETVYAWLGPRGDG